MNRKKEEDKTFTRKEKEALIENIEKIQKDNSGIVMAIHIKESGKNGAELNGQTQVLGMDNEQVARVILHSLSDSGINIEHFKKANLKEKISNDEDLTEDDMLDALGDEFNEIIKNAPKEIREAIKEVTKNHGCGGCEDCKARGIKPMKGGVMEGLLKKREEKQDDNYSHSEKKRRSDEVSQLTKDSNIDFMEIMDMFEDVLKKRMNDR